LATAIIFPLHGSVEGRFNGTANVNNSSRFPPSPPLRGDFVTKTTEETKMETPKRKRKTSRAKFERFRDKNSQNFFLDGAADLFAKIKA
jgi:hypothetical protein